MVDSPAVSPRAKAWQQGLALALLAIQPFIFFRGVVYSKTAHIPYDIEGFHFPLSAFVARCVREGIMPYWDPYSRAGASMWADIANQIFYPITWIALLLGNVSQGHKLLYWYLALDPLHMAIAGIFMYIFLRRIGCSPGLALFGGTTYQLGGFFASQAQHIGAICCGAWFPLLLLGVFELSRRITARWIGITAIAASLCFLAGFPAPDAVALGTGLLFIIALILLREATWKTAVAYFAALAVSVLICAVQWIPTAEASRLTIASLRGYWFGNGGGLPLQSLASFFWPDFYHVFRPFDPTLYKLPFNYTLMYTYSGHLAMVLVVLAPVIVWFHGRERSSWWLLISLALTVLSAIWMLGEATPLYTAIYTRLPRLVRGSLYAEYALMAFSLWVAVTAALALRELRLRQAWYWAAAILAAVNLIWVSSRRPMNTYDGGYKKENSEYVYLGDPALPNELHRRTGVTNPPLRIDFLGTDFSAFNAGAPMYRLYSATGDNPLTNLRFYYFRLSFSGTVYWDRIQALTSPDSRWIDFLNDGYLIVRDPKFAEKMDTKRYERSVVAGLELWKNKHVLPRFFAVDRVRRAAGMEEARALLPMIADPSKEAIVEGLDPAWSGSGAEATSVKVISYEHNRIELDVHANGPAYLVSSEVFYPGWSATVNGKPAELFPTNLAFRGLPVPAGDSRIVMSFRPNHLTLSLALGTIGTLLAIALAVTKP